MAEKKLWVFYDSLSKTQSKPVSPEQAQTVILKMRPPEIGRFFIWSTGWDNWQPLKSYLETDQKNFVSTFITTKGNLNEETVKATFREVTEQTQTSFQMRKEVEKEAEITASKTFADIRLGEETVSKVIPAETEIIKDPVVQFDGDEITWSGIQKPKVDFSALNKSMANRATRHELKIEILLISPKGKTFRSRSKNISLTGSLLQDTIPFDYYDTNFEVVVINNNTKDPLKARVKLIANTVKSEGLTQRIHFTNTTDGQKKSLQALLEDYIATQKIKGAFKAS